MCTYNTNNNGASRIPVFGELNKYMLRGKWLIDDQEQGYLKFAERTSLKVENTVNFKLHVIKRKDMYQTLVMSYIIGYI